jgi:hypothetical protein
LSSFVTITLRLAQRALDGPPFSLSDNSAQMK